MKNYYFNDIEPTRTGKNNDEGSEGPVNPFNTKTSFKAREISYYSQVSPSLVKYTRDELQPFQIPERVVESKDGSHKYLMNVKEGVKNFKPMVFGESQSRIANFLACIINHEYQSQKQPKSKSGIPKSAKILAHCGLFTDIVLRDRDKYIVIPYQGQLIFATTNRRVGENHLLSYIGIRFEDMLKTQPKTISENSNKSSDQHGARKSSKDAKVTYEYPPTLDNKSHYKSMLEIELKKSGLICQVVVEVDATNPSVQGNNGADIDPLTQHTEMKLVCTEDAHRAIRMNKAELLKFLRSSVNYFSSKLLKWVLQCSFGSMKHVVVGVRSWSFNITAIKCYELGELVEFLRLNYPTEYSKYLNSVETAESTLNWVVETVKPDCVYTLDLSRGGSLQEYDPQSKEYSELRDNVLTPEFIDWREKGVVSEEMEKGEYCCYKSEAQNQVERGQKKSSQSRKNDNAEKGVDKLTEGFNKLDI